jgi:photosystem II stability/assembly factor-like uncharacterized protein
MEVNMLKMRFVLLLVGLLISGQAGFAAEPESSGPGLVWIDRHQSRIDLAFLRSGVESGVLTVAGHTDRATFIYAGTEGVDLLRRGGFRPRPLPEIGGREVYLVRSDGSPLPSEAEILYRDGSQLLVAVDPARALAVHLLPSKRRLPGPGEIGLPVLTGPALRSPPHPPALSSDPRIQAVVDSVSTTRLYEMLCRLSGEDPITAGGETYTLTTRYSPTVLCRVAGTYLGEQFEALGLDVEYHYFNFRTIMKGVWFVDASEGWACGKRNTVIHTTDGGQTWEEQSWGDQGGLNDLFMVDASTGFVAGHNGRVLRTVDGETWTELSPPTSENLFGVWFVDGSTGLVCGDDGSLLRTTDGGDTWSSISSGTSRDLRAICFTSAVDGWLVGASGEIRKTADGGLTWSGVSSPVGHDLLDVTFAAPDTGWIAGASGTLLRTTDGSTWQETVTGTGEDIRSVYFLDSTVGWICGTAGRIFTTGDGGDNWYDRSLETQPDLNAVWFVDLDRGQVFGKGMVLATTDGGTEWSSIADDIESGDVNVVATLPGTTRPDEIYIVCGHYDSISNMPETLAPGADDNATGTICALEAARVLRENDYECTIRFVCFAREEQGLIGSAAYAQDVFQRGDNILGVLNFDMIGYVDAYPEDIDILYDGNSGWLATAYDSAAALYVPELDVYARFYPGAVWSDHASFWDYGYPAFCGIEDNPPNNPHYHKTHDVVDYVDMDFFTDVVKAGVAAVAGLATVDTVTSSIPPVAEASPIRVTPNPGGGRFTIEMPALRAGQRWRIYDIGGRLVSDVEPVVHGDTARAIWEGTGTDGRAVSAGIYFLKPAGRGRAIKMVVLR